LAAATVRRTSRDDSCHRPAADLYVRRDAVTRAFVWICVAYATAAMVAMAAAYGLDAASHPLAVAAAGDVAATVAIFVFSFAFGNSSFYDPYWSLAPVPIAVYWAATAPVAAATPARQVVVLTLVTAWAVRLTFNWARGWHGLGHEDWRYVDLASRTGRLYWLVSFAGIHMMPTIWVFLGLLPVYAAVAGGHRPLGALDALAATVTAGAIWLEARADAELRRFRLSPQARQEILATGVWAWSRHPNYFGEMSFWWGLYLFGLAAAPAWWWTIIGAASITAMFRFISLPMMETRMLERRPHFVHYQATTPLVVPRPPRVSSALGTGREDL
jgi:steroid 5-alpha reductase family enzyme